MKNMSFIAFMMSHTKKEIVDFLDKKEARNIPEDLSKKAKYLIGQNGKKKEDVFRETRLSRDYLYKVLRGVKRVKERDYILAICFAANLDLVDAHMMLGMYNLPALQLDNERDVLLIHALNEEIGLGKTNKLLLEAGYHLIRTSPKSDTNDISPVRFDDIQIEQMDIRFDEVTNNIAVSAIGYTEDELYFEYTFCDGKKTVISNKNTDDAKVYQYLFEGIIWQRIAESMQAKQIQDGATSISSVQSKDGTKIIAETKRADKYYQVVRFSDGHMLYSTSVQNAMPYLYTQNTEDRNLYKVIYGNSFKPAFDIYGGDLEELENAEDIDIAVFLRMRREISKWRAVKETSQISQTGRNLDKQKFA